MSSYATFTTARTTTPDLVALIAALRTQLADPTAVLFPTGDAVGTWRGKKAQAWTAPDITAAQTLLDTTAPLTLELAAQHNVDAWPIELKALALALIDQLNVIRANLPTPLGAITPAQAIAAIRAKAGTL